MAEVRLPLSDVALARFRWRAAAKPAMHTAQGVEQPEVSIRRRPPEGLQHQPCGNQFQFEVHQTADNKPRNILEEIVWCASQAGVAGPSTMPAKPRQQASLLVCCASGLCVGLPLHLPRKL